MQPSSRHNLVRITRSSLPFFWYASIFSILIFSPVLQLCKKSQCCLFLPSSAFPFISHTSCERRPCSCLLYTYLPCAFNSIQVRFLFAFVLTSFVHVCLLLSCCMKTEWGRNTQLKRTWPKSSRVIFTSNIPWFHQEIKYFQYNSYFLRASY